MTIKWQSDSDQTDRLSLDYHLSVTQLPMDFQSTLVNGNRLEMFWQLDAIR